MFIKNYSLKHFSHLILFELIKFKIICVKGLIHFNLYLLQNIEIIKINTFYNLQ